MFFHFCDGYQQNRLNGTFSHLMLDTGLLKNEDGQKRTLYSLRHTYATFELLRGGTDIHTLSKQMGNSAAMIERHYGHLKPAQKAYVIAGKRMVSKKKTVEQIAEVEKPKLELVK
jgi:integrase